jgi:hypothetical protein
MAVPMPDVAPVTNAFIPFNDVKLVSRCLGYSQSGLYGGCPFDSRR